MSPRLRFAPLAAAAALAAGPLCPGDAPAQSADPPSVLFESPGGDRFTEDFSAVLDLAGEAGASQKQGLTDLLDAFLVGVDAKRAVRVEPLTDSSPTRYRLFIPVSDRRKFQRDNLDFGSGIPSRQLAGKQDTFRLGGVRGSTYEGYLKYFADPAGGEYAVIAEQLEDMPGGVAKIGGLLTPGDDAGMLLRNRAGGDAAVAGRWRRVDQARDELLGTLKKKPEESPEEYALRKAGAALQVTELGRFYAEAKYVLMRGSVPEGGIGGVSTLLFQPLEGTQSAAAFARAGDAPSRFAGVPFDEDANFCGHTRFPLTERQQAGLKDLGGDMRALMLAETKTAQATDAERAARVDAYNRLFDLYGAAVDSGVVDATATAETVEGKRRIVGAFALPDGADAVPAVEAFVASRSGREAALNVAEVAGVSLHKITLGDDFGAEVRDLLGAAEVWIGTGPNAFWYAGGPGAQEELTAQIEAAAAGGAASEVFFRLQSDPAAAGEILERIEAGGVFGDYKEVARDALRTCAGRVTLELKKDSGDKVVGRGIFPKCILTLVGRIIAEVSERENLAG